MINRREAEEFFIGT